MGDDLLEQINQSIEYNELLDDDVAFDESVSDADAALESLRTEDTMDIGNTADFASYEAVAPVAVDPEVDGFHVYGIGGGGAASASPFADDSEEPQPFDAPEEELPREDDDDDDNSATLGRVIAGVAGLALVASIGVFAVPRILAARNSEPAPEQTQAETPKEEPKKEETPKKKEEVKVVTADLSSSKIASLIGLLPSVEDVPLSLVASEVDVQVRDGRVLVIHTVPDGVVVDADSLARMAGLRANRLAAQLTNKTVGQNDEDEGVTFKDLTWVVRNAQGEAYLATVEGPGEERETGKRYGVLAGSRGYVLSPTLADLLGSDSGLEEKAGEAPTDLDGNEIVPLAMVTQRTATTQTETETTSTRQTQTTSGRTTSSGTTNTYSYNDTSYDDGGSDYGGEYSAHDEYSSLDIEKSGSDSGGSTTDTPVDDSGSGSDAVDDGGGSGAVDDSGSGSDAVDDGGGSGAVDDSGSGGE